jgi:A/G-specific adenine glycosylase
VVDKPEMKYSSMIAPHVFAGKLLKWYQLHRRDLPWRHTRDPYQIWLSEVILQQTRVQQGLPYFLRFLAQYPTVQDLAAAEEQEVLRLWQGLGYYSRARNMHATAKMIVETYGGQFPDHFQALQQLKGVGEYTAAAIATFAFQEKVAVVDGNVFRVLARVFGIEADIMSGKGKKVFRQLASSLVPERDADQYNQAIMEFGALHCKPANPDCMFCVFSQECMARLTSRQGVLPVKTRKVQVKNRYFHYFVILYNDKLALKQRVRGDIWQGLYDFPSFETTTPMGYQELKGLFATELADLPVPQHISEDFTHQLTHQKIFARFYHLPVQETSAVEKISKHFVFTLHDFKEVETLPKPILIHKYLGDFVF